MSQILWGWLILLLSGVAALRAESVVGVAGFEPANSCSQGKRVRPDFPTPRDSRAWIAFSPAVAGETSFIWSGPGRQSFVLSPEGSRTGPDFFDNRRNCTRSLRVIERVFNAGDRASAPGSCLAGLPVSVGLFHSGDAIRTRDLLVMNQPSYHCSTPHELFVAQQHGPCNGFSGFSESVNPIVAARAKSRGLV